MSSDVQVHFQPGALFRLLGIPLYEFGEHYFDAEQVLSSDVRHVSERLATARSYTEMVEAVESSLMSSIGRAAQKVLPVDRAAGLRRPRDLPQPCGDGRSIRP